MFSALRPDPERTTLPVSSEQGRYHPFAQSESEKYSQAQFHFAAAITGSGTTPAAEQALGIRSLIDAFEQVVAEVAVLRQNRRLEHVATRSTRRLHDDNY